MIEFPNESVYLVPLGMVVLSSIATYLYRFLMSTWKEMNKDR